MASRDIDEIKQKLSIEEVLGGYIKLEKAGKYLRARCPFHAERTASFTVTPERGWWHCFGCNKGGDIFTFVQEIEHIEFKDALALLAGKAGVQLGSSVREGSRTKVLYEIMEYATKYYEVQLRTTATPVVAYLLDRGLSKETIASFRIGWAPDSWDGVLSTLRKKGFRDADIEAAGLVVPGGRGLYDRFRGRIMFPIANSQGAIVAFSGRVLPVFVGTDQVSQPQTGAKYVNSPETPLYRKSKILFGYDRAKEAMTQHGRAIVVEGQMDLIMAHQAGSRETVALSGTACTPEHLGMIARFADTLVLALDRDAAGKEAAERVVRLAYEAGLSVVAAPLDFGKDPADMIRESPDAWMRAVASPIDYLGFRLQDMQHVEQKRKIAFIQKTLFPLVVHYRTDLERDQQLSHIADAAQVSLSALRNDFSRFAQSQAAGRRPVAVVTEPQDIRTTKRILLDQLIAIASLWKDPSRIAGLQSWFDARGGAGSYQKTVAAYQKRLPKLVTEAEIMYAHHTDDDLERVIQEVKKRYEIILAEEQLQNLLPLLHAAEQSGGGDADILSRIKQASAVLETAKQALQE